MIEMSSMGEIGVPIENSPIQCDVLMPGIKLRKS